MTKDDIKNELGKTVSHHISLYNKRTMRTQHGTYTEKINENVLEIEYEYYYDHATHYDQEEEIVDVKKVLANGQDITDFYWGFFDTDIMHDRILDYCRGN